MEDSQLLFKVASGYWVVVQGIRGWAIRVWASGEGGKKKKVSDNCRTETVCGYKIESAGRKASVLVNMKIYKSEFKEFSKATCSMCKLI